MAFRDSGKTKLSKGILEMKFMKRSKDKALKEIQEEEGRLFYENQITDAMKSGISNYVLEPSYIPCEGLIEGRLSYRGMNPEIERLLELEELDKRAPGIDRSMSKDISDVEMAHFKQSLVETVASKYKTKKNRKSDKTLSQESSDPSRVKNETPPRKKPKFMKPKDE